MAKIQIEYIDTSHRYYRPWQLDPTNPYYICIDCGALCIERTHPLNAHCPKCRERKDSRRLRRKRLNYRRRRRLSATGSLNYRRQWLKDRSHWQCVMCGCRKRGELTVDHIVRLASGGTNTPDNLQTLCDSCHRLKTLTEDLWEQERRSNEN